MFKKLVNGELSLGVTFWKFGIIGLLVLALANKFSAAMLIRYTGSVSLFNYFLHYFHPIYSSKMSILWTLCYLSSLLVLSVYTVMVFKGVWRASAAYDKSSWLGGLSRIFVVVFILVIWSAVRFRPFF